MVLEKRREYSSRNLAMARFQWLVSKSSSGHELTFHGVCANGGFRTNVVGCLGVEFSAQVAYVLSSLSHMA